MLRPHTPEPNAPGGSLRGGAVMETVQGAAPLSSLRRGQRVQEMAVGRVAVLESSAEVRFCLDVRRSGGRMKRIPAKPATLLAPLGGSSQT